MHPLPLRCRTTGKAIPFLIARLSKRSTMEVRVFESAKFGQVRTSKTENGDPLFCLADVCKALGLSNSRKVKTQLSPRGVTISDAPTNGGIQQLNFITEANLYRCIFQSRKEEAEQFQDWVCEEVLPAIRQTGGYIATQPEDTPELIMARALMVAQSTIEKSQRQLQAAQAVITHQSEQLKEQAPKVEYTDSVLNAATTYTSTQMAKELDLRTAEQLHALLKSWGVMIRQSGQWMLSAKYCGQNYTKTRTHPYTKQDGTQGTNSITVWTERGRWFLHQVFEQKSKSN